MKKIKLKKILQWKTTTCLFVRVEFEKMRDNNIFNSKKNSI